MARLSVVVICFNEEAIIDKCLSSAQWADEIIVLDSFSSDRTFEIARQFTDRVYQHPWLGYGKQKNLALDYATHPWVLCLDADEVLSPDLIKEIQALLGQGPELAGYRMPRMTHYLGRLLKHCWYPDYKLRLFKKGSGRWSEQAVHEEVLVTGPTGKLKNALLHYSFPAIKDHIQAIERYTTLGAELIIERGKPFSLLRLIGSPLVMFCKQYILKLGFLDGLPGFIASVLSGVHEFVKYAKLYELKKNGTRGNTQTG